MGAHILALLIDKLSLILGHPCPTLLAFTRMEVGIEHGEIGAVSIEHLVGLHVGMIHGDVLILLERDAIQAVGQSEDAVDHLVQLEVRAQHLGIDVIFLQLQLMAIESHVPRLDILFSACHSLQLQLLFLCCRTVGIDEVVEQSVDALHIARHTILQHIVGIGLEAQQLCYLPAQVHQSLANLQVVVLVLMNTLRIIRHIHLAAQFTLRAVGHKGRIRRRVEREHPTFQSALAGLHSGSLTCRVGQSVELCLVGDMQGEGFVLLQQVLRELQRQHRGLLGQLSQALLACLVEQCTATHKAVVAVVQQAFLLGSQLTVMAVHVLDALKESRVQSDVVGMLRQYGLYLLSQCVHLVVGLSREQVEEHRAHAVEQIIVAFGLVVLVDDGIVERGLGGVVDGFLYLLIITTDALHESLLVVFQSDAVEGYGVVGCIIWFKKWVLSLLYILIHNVMLSFRAANLQFNYELRIINYELFKQQSTYFINK